MHPAARALTVIVTYVLCWQFSAAFGVTKDVSALYPAAGSLLFFFYRWGWRTVFAATVAMLAANWPQDPLPTWGTHNYLHLLRQLVVYGGTALLARRFGWLALPLVSLAGVQRLLLLALAASLFSATLAAPIFWVFLPFLRPYIVEIFLGFWVGDFSGVLVFVGLASVIIASRQYAEERQQAIGAPTPAAELVALVALALAVIVLVGFTGAHRQLPAYSYLILLPVMLGTAMFGLNFGITAAVLANCVAMVTYSTLGLTQMPALQFQLLCGLIMAVAMLLGAAIDDRRVASFDAWHDPLTGAFNRRALAGQGNRFLERSRLSRVPVALIVLEVDQIGTINDTLGRREGDALLCAVAAKSQEAAGASDLFVRLGGARFALLAQGADATRAAQLGERLRLLASQPGRGRSAGRATASIGIALGDSSERGLDWLLAEAEGALHAARQGGGNRVQLAPVALAIPSI